VMIGPNLEVFDNGKCDFVAFLVIENGHEVKAKVKVYKFFFLN